MRKVRVDVTVRCSYICGYPMPRTAKRKPLKTAKDQVVRMRVPSAQRDRFMAAADAEGVTLSDWLRTAGDEKIARKKE